MSHAPLLSTLYQQLADALRALADARDTLSSAVVSIGFTHRVAAITRAYADDSSVREHVDQAFDAATEATSPSASFYLALVTERLVAPYLPPPELRALAGRYAAHARELWHQELCSTCASVPCNCAGSTPIQATDLAAHDAPKGAAA